MPFRPKLRIACPLLLLLIAAAGARAQAPKSVIVLDPAHGGPDNGAHLTGDAVEKDINLALAGRLRTLLIDRGFTVVMTREAETDAAATVSGDQRAEIANHAHPLACLILHATDGGHGVHLFTSALIPLTLVDEPKAVLAWDSAQAASIPQSLRLINELAASFNSVRVPLVVGRASIRPIDSMVCPAIAIEVAPLVVDAVTTTPVSDPGYQQSVAEAIANGLISWREHAEEAAAAAETAEPKKVVKVPEKKSPAKIPVESARPPTPARPKALPKTVPPAPKTGDKS